MPYKDPEKQKQAQRRHYRRNPDAYINRGLNWKQANLNPYDKRKKVEVPPLQPTLKELITRCGWHTPQSIAAHYNIPEPTVRNACTNGTLPYFKLGMFRVIEPEDAEEWVSNGHKIGKRSHKKRKPAPYYRFLAEHRKEDKVATSERTRTTATVTIEAVIDFIDEFDYAEQLLSLRDAVLEQANDSATLSIRVERNA